MIWVGSAVRVYIPGRSLTGCRPLSTRIDDSSYLSFAKSVSFTLWTRLFRASREPSGRVTSAAPAPAIDARFHRLQQRIDHEADHADGNHSRHHDRGADVRLALHEQIADAARGNDELGPYERLPRQARAYTQSRHDRRHRRRQQHLGND